MKKNKRRTCHTKQNRCKDTFCFHVARHTVRTSSYRMRKAGKRTGRHGHPNRTGCPRHRHERRRRTPLRKDRSRICQRSCCQRTVRQLLFGRAGYSPGRQRVLYAIGCIHMQMSLRRICQTIQLILHIGSTPRKTTSELSKERMAYIIIHRIIISPGIE